ncbi:MAG: DUF5103 domain-containing protein [Bacteroidales bacterium]|nr:DUF5103 domain-containing protein [Bacteroidales bacterium]
MFRNNILYILLIFIYVFVLLILSSCAQLMRADQGINTLLNEQDSLSVSGNISDNSQVQDQDFDYFKKDYTRTYNHIYNPNIQTIQLYRQGWEMTQPYIQLKTDERLMLSFDDLDPEVKDYKFTLVHCDANWQPSDLLQNEYLLGFTEDFIRNYKFSINTMQQFVHYDLVFPTEDMQIMKSGNYLLKVYDDIQENMAFVFRFMVFEPLVTINANVVAPSTIADRKYKQEVDFILNSGAYKILNPYSDLKIVITQNGRWDNALIDFKPRMVKNSRLYYDLVDENVFNGGNEFRLFNIKSLKYALENVYSIEVDNKGNQVYLMNDEPRTFKLYTYVKDINGMRIIQTEDYENDDLESDYVYVHFSLPYNAPFVDGNLYIMGELTYWQFSDEGLMHYNYERKAYEATMFLKQGYYNYQYVFLEDGKTAGDVTLIEGNHFDTENEYKIFVYHREIGTIYDKLIAIHTVYSHAK